MIAVGITATAVAVLGIGVIIALNAAEHRRLCAARRKFTERQAVIDDTLPQVFTHVPPADAIGAEIEQWLERRSRG